MFLGPAGIGSVFTAWTAAGGWGCDAMDGFWLVLSEPALDFGGLLASVQQGPARGCFFSRREGWIERDARTSDDGLRGCVPICATEILAPARDAGDDRSDERSRPNCTRSRSSARSSGGLPGRLMSTGPGGATDVLSSVPCGRGRVVSTRWSSVRASGSSRFQVLSVSPAARRRSRRAASTRRSTSRWRRSM